jgi:hypothetical protein
MKLPETKVLGIDKIVIELTDAIELGSKIEKQLQDGFQPLPDLLSLVGEQDRVMRLIANGKPALEELVDLTDSEAEQVTAQVAKNTRLQPSQVALVANYYLNLVERTYALYKKGNTLLLAWQKSPIKFLNKTAA